MIKLKDPNRIKQTLEMGENTYRDAESGYKYSLGALCHNDHNECSVTSFERATAEESKIKRVTFYCPICSRRFDASPEEMFLW